MGEVPVCDVCGHRHILGVKCTICGHVGRSKIFSQMMVTENLHKDRLEIYQVAAAEGVLCRELRKCWTLIGDDEFDTFENVSWHAILWVGDLPMVVFRWRVETDTQNNMYVDRIYQDSESPDTSLIATCLERLVHAVRHQLQIGAVYVGSPPVLWPQYMDTR